MEQPVRAAECECACCMGGRRWMARGVLAIHDGGIELAAWLGVQRDLAFELRMRSLRIAAARDMRAGVHNNIKARGGGTYANIR